MNVYVGNSINDIDIDDRNVEFSDELIEHIFNRKNIVSFDISKLYEINPYSDVEISSVDIPMIINICNNILNSTMLKTYEDFGEAKRMLEGLIDICQDAIKRGAGIVSIGD